MSINLVIKGNIAQAIQAAHDRGISLNQTYYANEYYHETLARCASDYRAAVVEWFHAGPQNAPFPIGALLLFSENGERE
jgi:hypothetical protein